MKKFMLLHGVNHNMFGKRNPEQYGTVTLDEINENVKKLPVHEKIPFLVWSFKYEYVTIKWKEKQSPAEEK